MRPSTARLKRRRSFFFGIEPSSLVRKRPLLVDAYSQRITDSRNFLTGELVIQLLGRSRYGATDARIKVDT